MIMFRSDVLFFSNIDQTRRLLSTIFQLQSFIARERKNEFVIYPRGEQMQICRFRISISKRNYRRVSETGMKGKGSPPLSRVSTPARTRRMVHS